MNLHGMVSGAIGTVNPHVMGVLRRSNGYTTLGDGKRSPIYLPDEQVQAQVQPLTYGDIQQADGLNIQGYRKGVYLRGKAFGLLRGRKLGGDLLIFGSGVLPEGNVWLVAHVLEQWPDWCKVVITLQNDDSATNSNGASSCP